VSPPGPDHAGTRRAGRPTEAELLAAKRIVSGAERRGVEEAEALCRDARVMLEAAAAEVAELRAEAERVLSEARAEAQRILDDAARMRTESRGEAEQIRSATVVATADASSGGDTLVEDVGRRRLDAALAAVDPSVGDIEVLVRLLGDDLSADVRLAAVAALARAPEPDQLGALGVALADPDPAVRASAVETLPVAGTSRAATQLLAGADDGHHDVRAAAYRRLASASPWILWMALGRCTRRSELLGVVGQELPTDRLGALVAARLCSPEVADRVLALELTAAGSSARWDPSFPV